MLINTIAKFISKKIVKSKLLKSNESRVFNATELTGRFVGLIEEGRAKYSLSFIFRVRIICLYERSEL